MGGFHTDFILAALAALFAVSLSATETAHAQQLQAVTERGNVFVLERAGGDGGDDGVSGLAGFGSASRLIYKEYDGIVMHGTGRTGLVDSMIPYHRVPAHTDFVAAIGSSGGSTKLAIPEFYLRYDLAQGRLAESSLPSPDTDNILGYSAQRTLWGDAAVSSISARGIEITGDGRLVLKLNEMDGTFAFRGTLAPGTDVRMVESPYDLMALSHDRAMGGFLTSHARHDPGTDVVGRINKGSLIGQ